MFGAPNPPVTPGNPYALGTPPEPAVPPTLTGMRCPANSAPLSAFWQDYPRPVGTLEVRCRHCKCWFGFHGDRAICPCAGGCGRGCPGFEPAETNDLPKKENTAA